MSSLSRLRSSFWDTLCEPALNVFIGAFLRLCLFSVLSLSRKWNWTCLSQQQQLSTTGKQEILQKLTERQERHANYKLYFFHSDIHNATENSRGTTHSNVIRSANLIVDAIAVAVDFDADSSTLSFL